jgi:50S ribosomal subunit-associated GTPase HflX
VSAVERQGFDQLAKAVAERLAGGYDEYEINTYPGHGKLLMFLKDRAEILSETHHDDQYVVRCRIPRRFAWMLKQIEGITIAPAAA